MGNTSPTATIVYSTRSIAEGQKWAMEQPMIVGRILALHAPYGRRHEWNL